jgi:hypothetical protein
LLIFDHFHITKDGKELVRHLKNIKESHLTETLIISAKRDKAKTPPDKRKLSIALKKAVERYEASEQLHHDVDLLVGWFQYDILAFTSVMLSEREELYDFIIEEFEPRAQKNDRVYQFLKSIIHQRSSLMKAISHLEKKFETIAKQYVIPLAKVWEIAKLSKYGFNSVTYHTKSDLLDQEIGEKFDEIEDAILASMDDSDRTSCMVENFNSRLSPYLDERKGFKDERLSLIQFGLNHRPFMRSEHKKLVGKTPAQVMSGIDHPHWLEMLGFKRFKLAA